MNPAVAIFVKTPGYSRIKTRLSARMGGDFAEQWHRRSAAAVAQCVKASGLAGYWAVAETRAVSDEAWPGLPNLDQGAGELGERMARVHSQLIRRHGAAILVGADLPQVSTEHLSRAAAWLRSGEPRQVLGPAADGGFWLFGANRNFDPERWRSVAYSQDDTARSFIGALAPDAAWELLETRTDLDRAEDLPALLAELRALSSPLPLQRALTEWLEDRLEQAA